MTGGSCSGSIVPLPGAQRSSAGIPGPWPISGFLHPFQMVHASISSGPCETHAHVSTSHTLRHPPSSPLSPHAAQLVHKQSPRKPSVPRPKKRSSQRNVMQCAFTFQSWGETTGCLIS